MKRAKVLSPAQGFWVVDVSNTFTKFSWSSFSKLGKVYRHPTAEVTAAWLKSVLCQRAGTSSVFLSSVVPRCTEIFQRVVKNQDSLSILHGAAEMLLEIDYPHPAQIGPDRLANAIAAQTYYGAPCIVLDFGTAVTFDIINPQGAYCGGVIAPGLNAMTDYLHEKTALLPKVVLREPQGAVGKSTEEAILVGAMIGYRGMIREILQAIRQELQIKKPLQVVATGGQAELVTRQMPEIAEVRPHLTLEGLRIWARGHGGT